MSRYQLMYGDPEGWSGVSASGAGPALQCPARLALPQARTTGEYAERGNELHAYARICGISQDPEVRKRALEAVPEDYRDTASKMNIDLALDGIQVLGCERAFALDVKKQTVRYIGSNIDRSYNEELVRQGQPPLSKYEIPFTIDVDGFIGETPVELDYKSGQSIGDPALHWQRRICAVGLMLFHDTATAISRVAYIKEDGSIEPDGCEFSILDVDDFCAELARGIDAVITARKQFAEGVMPAVNPSDDACKYCNAITSCPYQTNFAKAMMGRLAEIEKGPEVSTLTPEEQGQVWADLKRAEKLVEMGLASLKAMAAQRPIPIGDKYEVRPNSRSKTYFDAAKARGLIVTLLGQQGEDEEEIQRKLSKLYGRTEYEEYRKVKRQLDVV